MVSSIAPSLVAAAEWPSLAHAIDRAHAAGYDVATQLPRLAIERPLSDARPARDLQYRLINDVPVAAATTTGASDRADRAGTGEAARRRLVEHPDERASQTRADEATPHEQQRPEDRWRTLVATIGADILTEDGWAALAATLDTAAAHGVNVEEDLPRIATAAGPLPRRNAAAELRYRFLAEVDLDPRVSLPTAPEVPPPQRRQQGRQPVPPTKPIPGRDAPGR